MKFGALALLAAGASAKSPSNDVTIGHIAASLDELCNVKGSPACDKTLGEIVGDGHPSVIPTALGPEHSPTKASCRTTRRRRSV